MLTLVVKINFANPGCLAPIGCQSMSGVFPMSVSPTEGRGLFQWCLASWSTSLRDSTPELFRRIDSRAEMVGMVRVRLILVGPRKVWLPLAPGCAPLMVERADEGVVERSVLERRQLPEGRWEGAGGQRARG